MNPRIAIDESCKLTKRFNAKRLMPFSTFLLLFCFLVPSTRLLGQTFTSTGTWVCPVGVTSITVECWGGGGAGGGSVGVLAPNAGAGGGGGGYTKKTSVSVTPGNTYNIIVGQGGSGNVAFTVNGNNGGNSYFGTSTALAYGGNGGGGNGGSIGSGGIGSTWNGGDGALAKNSTTSGGGGGGAGYGSVGGNANQITPGSGGTGNSSGTGGAGFSSNANGNPGNIIAGGGSGAGYSGILQSWTGGSGANGEVILTNTSPPTVSGISSNICVGGSITITGTNFAGITAANVKIGATAVSSITSSTSTQIVAVVATACTGTVSVTTTRGTATSSATFTAYSYPAAPTVITPINYCLNAVASQLTATGSNLTWGSGSTSGTAGGSSVLTSTTYVSNPYSNKQTNFTTTAANVQITTINYYIPAYQTVAGVQLALYNSSGTVIATSSTITNLNNNVSKTATISNTFNYTIAAAGNYSIGVIAGTGTIGGDNTTFPITEPTGTINVTGTNNLGAAPYHCFNNIQFIVNNGSIAPTPSTSATGTTNYLVTQTLNGCVSPQATIAVIVNTPPSATISYSGTPYCNSLGTAQNVTLTGTSGGTYSASPSGLSINTSTGAITPSTSTPGTYNVTYTIPASGGCAVYTTTTSLTVSALSVGGSVGSNATVCSGTNSGTLNLTGQTGSILNWQYSINGGTTWTSIANTTTSQTYSNLTQTTLYRALVQSGVCSSANSSNATITVSPAPSATISYSGSPFCINSGTASVTSTGTTGGAYSSTAGLSINSATGVINLNSSTAGAYTVTYTIAASGGCSIYTTTTSITVTPSVGTPVFALGSTSTRCQGAGSVTYTATATNAGGISYSLDATSISGGNSINSSTGAVTYSAGWNGISTITASASGCGGPAASTHTVTTGAPPSVSVTTTYTCVGGTSGTITASGSAGSTPYTYSLNGGTYQSSNLFTGLAAGTYTLSIKSNSGCTASTPASVIVSPYPNSTDDQTAAGANTWIGHMYSGMNFQNYIGHFTEAETFDEGFGGDYNCFTVSSGATYPSIYTEQFSVRFRMNSSREGLYVADLGSDDGSRLYVDGTLIYNNWADQAFSTRPSVLMNLTGSSSLVYEFYENAINNRVIFNNLTLILANNLTSNTTQSICTGNTGSAIGGDSFGTLPSGISLSGTGYQWTYSSTPTGTRTNISGATSATYSPNTLSAPFNAAGTYYIYRNAKLSSTNNTGVSPYIAANKSNAAIITVISSSLGGTAGSNSTVCSGTNSGTVNLTGQNGNVLKWQYSVDGGTTWTDIANSTTSQSFSNLTQTTLGRAVVQSGVCTFANSNPATITVNPVSVGGTVNSSATVCSSTNSGTLNLTGNTGTVIRWEYSTDGGATWTTIANTTTSQTYSNITQTTQYRAVVQSGVCASVNSSAATITVNPVSVGGAVNSNATVCSGTNTGTLNLTGNTGSVIRWEYSTNGGSTWTTIANTTTSQTSSNITQTTLYRAVVQSGVCASVNSNPGTITVNPIPSASILYSGSPFCSGGATGTVTQTGTTGGTYSSTSGLAINSLTGAIDVSSSTPGNYIVTYNIAAGVYAAYSTTTNVLITQPGSWIGTVSADWNDTRNWLCGQIPNSAIHATISGGASYYPNITSGIMPVRNININSGGTLTVAGGTLQIFGSITNSGTFDASNGTIEMHGASSQIIPAGAFTNNNVKNLIISNTSSGGVTVAGNVDIYQSLTYGAGGTTLNTGGYITLKSNATETAWVGDMTGHTITGDVTVERYVAAINNWQFLSVPTQTTQTIHQAWQENQAAGVAGSLGYGTNITGPTGGIGFDFISPNVSMKYWDNSAGAYKTIMNTGVQFPNKTNGFFIYIRGDRRATALATPPHQPTILRSKGPLYTGSVDFIVPANSYYSLGNPYASKVDFSNVSGMSSIGSNFYVWDPLIYGTRGAGGYQTLSYAAGFKPLIPTSYYDVSTAYPYLESGQAAFVYNASASPVTLTFTESDKTTGSHLVFRGQDVSSSQFFRTYLSTSSGKIADGNAVAFNKNYQNRLDANDAVKFSNTGENFGLRLDGTILAIEARSPVQAGDTLFYDMRNVAQAVYQLRFSPESMQTAPVVAFLVDNYLKSKTEISLAENSTANFTVNSDAASNAVDRFMVVFEQAAVLPVTFVSIKATEKDKNILVAWQVVHENNMQQYEVEKSTDGNQFEKVATTAAKNSGSGNYQWTDENATSGYNYYRVKSVGKDNNSLYSTVVKLLVDDLKSTINIFPNPITDGIVHLQFKNQPQGKYRIRLVNSLGALILAKDIQFTGGNGSEDIKWDYKMARGIYQLEITKPDGSAAVIKVKY